MGTEINAIRHPQTGFLFVYRTVGGQNFMLPRVYHETGPGEVISPSDVALTINAFVLGEEPQRVPLPRGGEVGRRAFQARTWVRDRVITPLFGRNSFRVQGPDILARILEFENQGGLEGADQPGVAGE